ncbi:GNAT family N-acetyltransferase [Herbiconiux moechotypicola]|uniref:GNAT family protein n=1 Tax=Herbiconiux moechotypicola TaxID=637393 RepID=A0ABN3D6B8_9MICO|nr:GNAT family N-acetyltransferase [Herbiconiux moechotypicola]MCS5728629.1 GNAT family N-acetyltransferase [Herbiconiux moechotypicola]
MAANPYEGLLPLDLGGGLVLELRDRARLVPAHELLLRNVERLRAWEEWAQAEQSLAQSRAYTDYVLALHAQGRSVPALITLDGAPVGSITLKVDPVTRVGEIGYWIDGRHEGEGLVTRAAAALRDAGFALGLARIELRAAVTNTRSRRVAERLGFRLEGVLRAALPLGDRRLDAALYAQLPSDPRV